MTPRPIPVTVVTGFLGAGKTTLVNHLLAHVGDAYIGIIVNEYGEVGIDGDLIVAEERPLIEITNGCICCTVRKDLAVAVENLLHRAGRPIDHLIIETSGLADPAPVLQTFLADPDMRQRVSLESVVAVADAHHVLLHMEDDLVREQLAFADVIILNKTDGVRPSELDRLEAELRMLNPVAHRIRSERARVAAAEIIGVKRFSLSHVLDIEPDLLEGGEHEHEHDSTIQSTCIEADAPLDPTLFNRWLNQTVQRDGAQLLRTKGILSLAGEARRFHVHSVHMLLDATPGRRWRDDEPRRSRMVFIGRSLQEQVLRKGFLACVAA
jgi:G3E family GTPase